MQAKAPHPLANKIPSHIIALFSDPVLQKGEDPGPYWKMVSFLIDEQKPSDFFDWTNIQDLATSMWDERFYRAASNAIIRGGRRLAVHQFFREIELGEGRVKGTTDGAAYRADRYFSLNKQESEKTQSDLAKYGISDAEILGRSTQNNIDTILKLESIVGSRKRTQRKLQKEMQKRGSSQEVKSSASADSSLPGEKRPGSCQEVEAKSDRQFEGQQSADSPAKAQAEVRRYGVSASGSCHEMRADLRRVADEVKGIDFPRSCQEEKGTHQHGH
ncbi:MAG: hypothetical protein EKK33_18345 [Bradyrhizobiaceae bacterium]|nr:MAG: hypothetical protein EKK33_18345 [Bradyrhizobiaceae bacterium]